MDGGLKGVGLNLDSIRKPKFARFSLGLSPYNRLPSNTERIAAL